MRVKVTSCKAEKHTRAPLSPDEINEYFGSSVAFYFSFLDFYTWSLLLPAVLGVVITCFAGWSHSWQHFLVCVSKDFMAFFFYLL